jgi:hypothetical protein
MQPAQPIVRELSCQLRFQSLFRAGRALAFPCDPEGHVDLDRLSDRAKTNYLFARAMVGRDFAVPMVLHEYENPMAICV